MSQKHSLLAALIAASVVLGQPSVGTAPPMSDWSAPVNLGDIVNSPWDEQLPALSKDGLSLYFTSNRPGGFGGQDIWVSERADGTAPWGPPFNLGAAVNGASNDNGPAFSRDGHWLFFHSNRPGGYGGFDLMASWRPQVHDDFGWLPPVNLGQAVNTAFGDAGPSYLEDGGSGTPQLYFGSDRPGVGGFDIYVADFGSDGTLGPARLVPELSSPVNDQRPAIRFDGREIFFFSARPGSRNQDIWVSTRATVADPWTPPINVASVNSAFNDAQCVLSSDGRTLVFSSDRPGGVGGVDLWLSTRGR